MKPLEHVRKRKETLETRVEINPERSQSSQILEGGKQVIGDLLENYKNSVLFCNFPLGGTSGF